MRVIAYAGEVTSGEQLAPLDAVVITDMRELPDAIARVLLATEQ